jgi:hypothetical protein
MIANDRNPPESSTALDTSIRLEIYRERVRQAKYAFNLALIAIAISAGLLLSGQYSIGILSASGSLGSSAYCAKFSKDANDRLDRLIAELEG